MKFADIKADIKDYVKGFVGGFAWGIRLTAHNLQRKSIAVWLGCAGVALAPIVMVTFWIIINLKVALVAATVLSAVLGLPMTIGTNGKLFAAVNMLSTVILSTTLLVYGWLAAIVFFVPTGVILTWISIRRTRSQIAWNLRGVEGLII